MEIMSYANELEDRLIDFAVRIIHLANSLPDSPAAKHIARQLLRSGTSPAPNYAEARGAESNADFVHKLKVALKELNESSVWLRMICRANLMKIELMEELIDENRQLGRRLRQLTGNNIPVVATLARVWATHVLANVATQPGTLFVGSYLTSSANTAKENNSRVASTLK